MESDESLDSKKPSALNPFRRAVVRGLAILLPPLLTIVILLWAGNTIADYLLDPLEGVVRRVLLNYFDGLALPSSRKPKETIASRSPQLAKTNSSDTTPDATAALAPLYKFDQAYYRRAQDGRYVLSEHFDEVATNCAPGEMPAKARDIYEKYIEQRFLRRHVVIPVFLCLFLLALYLLGKFMAAGIGRFFWAQFEWVIHRLPLVRGVYSSVKQISDFMFSERDIKVTRVVAVEYPRRGIWSIAMVTGESLLDIRCAANEPVLALLIPSSPMPLTGYTITVRKSETIDLNLTVEQACQFLISCGVVVPPQQMIKALADRPKSDGDRPPVPAFPSA